MNLAEELSARGLIEHSSAKPEDILAAPRTTYLGIDPTADSLHIGHLEPILFMRRLGAAGFPLIFLVGGATGQIGDPKETGERSLLDEKTARTNTRAIKRQLKGLLGKTPFKLVDNADWLTKERLVPFLREVGKHFTVNELVKRELIKKRLTTPDESISYTEFSYALLQAYDFLTLYEKYGCDLQVGASDQWTNILSGLELIRKKKGKEAYALTVPLFTDASGKKFGKSEGNAIWLDPGKTSPFAFYQFWMNLPDKNVEKYLKAYTLLSLAEITTLMELHNREPAEREAQKTLARLVTEIVHGSVRAENIAKAANTLFGDTPPAEWPADDWKAVLTEVPSVAYSKDTLEEGLAFSEALVAGGIASSKSDGRRLIGGKGIMVNGKTVENPDAKLSLSDLPNGRAVVRKGRQGVLVIVLK